MSVVESSKNFSGRVLIVDDEPRNVAIIEEILEGFELYSARSGEEALDKTRTYRPDVIFLDVMMPGMDGYEVCRKIREDRDLRFVKIVFVSGKASIQERLAGYEAGGDDYITKPFDHNEILAKLRVFLRLKWTEEVDQIKGDFLHLVSHETRTPLTGILGFSDLIANDESLRREDLVDYGRRIYSCAKNLQAFVDKILLFCELKAKGRFQPTPTALKGVVRMAVDSTATAARKTDVTVDVELPDVEVSCDQVLLSTAVSYVLDNAIRFSRKGAAVEVRGTAHEESVEISVRDRGEGISPNAKENIFDEFSIRDLAHHCAGHGLSLAIARWVTRLHGGELGVESEVGKGATFLFRLPRAPASSADRERIDVHCVAGE